MIQFAANTQINEGNVEKIMQSETVPDSVKKTFVESYLSKNQAPALPPTSTNTPTTVTAAGEEPKIHGNQFEQKKGASLLSALGKKSILETIIGAAVDILLMSTVGKVLAAILGVIVTYIAARVLYWLLKMALLFIRRRQSTRSRR